MHLLPEKLTGRDLVRYSGETSLSERVLLKNQVATLLIWLGRRDLVNRDLEAFGRASYMWGFQPNIQIEIPNAGEIDDPQLFRPVITDLIPNLDRMIHPLAVFTVMTAQVAEKPWSISFCEAIRQYRWETRQSDDTAVYRIIMGGGFSRELFGSYYKRYFDLYDKNQEPRFWPDEEIAQKLGTFYLFFNSDAPTAGCERLVDFMGRILGGDLPGAEYPAYSFEEITKIAWHINRESFNASPKPGSIPKYSIGQDGRPIFPF